MQGSCTGHAQAHLRLHANGNSTTFFSSFLIKAMVVDYSKWDKLELSDDSDIEVHPNVDKRSFIRWKQRDIHEKRERMKARMAQLELNKEMNTDLLERVEYLIERSESGGIQLANGPEIVGEAIQQKFSKEGPTRVIEEQDGAQQPRYIDMIISLMERIHGEVEEMGVESSNKQAAYVKRLQFHQQKLKEALEVEQKEYEELVEERSHHILSEDIHTGFDSTFVNKKAALTAPRTEIKHETKIEKSTEIEVLNPSSSSSPTLQAKDDNVEASSDAVEFSKINVGDFESAYRFLVTHPHIVTEKEKDGLMMQAFQQQLQGRTDDMKRTVHNALLLQYCAALGPDGIRLFFSRVQEKNHPAVEALRKDAEFTSNHIITRCEVIKSEQSAEGEEEGVEQIQLHAVDPETEILVHVPEQDSPGWAIYQQFGQDMKKAIETKKLDEINKVLANMSVEEAEELVQKFDECGVLSVEPKIYDAEEWQKHKHEIDQELTEESEQTATGQTQTDQGADYGEEPVSTVEEVD